MAASYNAINNSQQGLTANHPYGAGDPYYAESTGFITPQQPLKKKGLSNWIKIGVPVLILVIVAAVLGGVLGSRAANNKDAASSDSSNGGAAHSPGASINLEEARFATATDSQYLEPLYPSTVSFFPMLFCHQLTLHHLRLPPPFPLPRSALLAMVFLPGLKRPSRLPAPNPPVFVRIDLVLSPPHINGLPYPASLPRIPTFEAGMILFLGTPPIISMPRPLFTLWMVTVAFSMLPARSKRG
jgi:hypothetical protein